MLEEASIFLFISVILLMISTVVGVIQFFLRRADDANFQEARSVADTLATLSAAIGFLGIAVLIVEFIVSPIYAKEALLATAFVTAAVAVAATFIYIGIRRSRASDRS